MNVPIRKIFDRRLDKEIILVSSALFAQDIERILDCFIDGNTEELERLLGVYSVDFLREWSPRFKDEVAHIINQF